MLNGWTGVKPDRLGSPDGTHGRVYPYGEVSGSVSVDQDETFTTYKRDIGTGLDYAQNRYYASSWGRFTTADPYRASGGAEEPSPWNPYAYVENNPINLIDPRGLYSCGPEGCGDEPGCDPGNVRQAPGTGPCKNLITTPVAYPKVNRDLLGDAIDRAKKALSENEDCRNLFGNDKTRAHGFDPATILDKIQAGTFATLKFEDLGEKGDVANVKPDGIPKMSSVTITINAHIGTGAYWNVGNTDWNAELLLHELGHVYDLTRGSGGSRIKSPDDVDVWPFFKKASMWNDWKVDQACFNGALGMKKP